MPIFAHTVKSQWINFSLYFPNFMYKTKRRLINSRICTHIIPKDRLKGNNKPIGANQRDNVFLGNGDTYQTDFIEVDKVDLTTIFYDTRLNNTSQLALRVDFNLLKGTTYKRSSTALNTNQETNNNDMNQYYFFKGLLTNDIFQYLVNSKVI
jgi:hypothetical protein